MDTPPTDSGDADLSRVQAVLEALPASAEHPIVMKSTVPVGTGPKLRDGWPSSTASATPRTPSSCGRAAPADFQKPDRVVIGADAALRGRGRIRALYEPIDRPIVGTDVASAEMIKLASNAFLATKISFINEIANVCEEVGADVDEVAAGWASTRASGPAS